MGHQLARCSLYSHHHCRSNTRRTKKDAFGKFGNGKKAKRQTLPQIGGGKCRPRTIISYRCNFNKPSRTVSKDNDSLLPGRAFLTYVNKISYLEKIRTYVQYSTD
mmetsp:Transcript_35902/g.41629  ORF Transcript_35902/g.41629 Transcript_35902/m.41629 type:complete len:105 (+) Transcript_35902:1729-2043(+)